MSTLYQNNPGIPSAEVRQHPERAHYDRPTIHAILDEALYCNVGVIDYGWPVVIPMLHARLGETVYLHALRGSRLSRFLAAGRDVCITTTLVNGLVLARSAPEHSMNYRSAVVFGSSFEVEDADLKLEVFESMMERLIPGRWADVRTPDDRDMARTRVVAIPIERASAKIRTGPPIDCEADLDLPVWAGELQLERRSLRAVPEPGLNSDILLPSYLENLTTD